MKVAIFSARSYEKEFFEKANAESALKHELRFFDSRLESHTTRLAEGYDVVCAFVIDDVSKAVLERLKELGVKLVALRSAGFNHVDLKVAHSLGIKIVRVPQYSPHAVAEHTLALMFALNRKLIRAHSRVHECNFSLEGLMGFDFFGKTAGVIGTGAIGQIVARLLKAMGLKVLAFDPFPNSGLQNEGIKYSTLDEIFKVSDVITLHCPLNASTQHLIDEKSVEKMKEGVMLINTSRGALIDTAAIIQGLKSKKIGYLGLDVYEEETQLFFKDSSNQVLEDDVFARLLTFPNVLITGHQAFFTREALGEIARTTIENITQFERNEPLKNEVLWKENG